MTSRAPRAKRLLAVLSLTWLLCAAPALHAQDPPVEAAPVTLEQGTPAKPLNRPQPKYPLALRQAGYEGWVLVSFIVEPDGSVSEVIIEDSSASAFEEPAREAVLRWKYEPATVSGMRVEQAYTSVLIVFGLQLPPGARSQFVRSYRDVVQQLSDGKLEAAEHRIVELSQSEALSLSERSYTWLLDAELRRRRGETDRQLRSLWRATISRGKFLARDVYAGALSQLFLLQLKRGNLSSALSSYLELKEIQEPAADLVELARRARDVVASEDSIGTPGSIPTSGDIASGEAKQIWTYRPLRRDVAFQDVEGALETIEFRCSGHRAKDAISPEKTWTIPQSWGSCVLFVSGAPGTAFTLVEYAPGSTTPK